MIVLLIVIIGLKEKERNYQVCLECQPELRNLRATERALLQGRIHTTQRANRTRLVTRALRLSIYSRETPRVADKWMIHSRDYRNQEPA
jgi:hypothetical protein